MTDTPSTSWATWAWQAYKDGRLADRPADRIEALTAQLAEDADARTQIDHRLEELVAQVDALTAERDEYKRLAGIAETVARECKIHEARADKAEAERDALKAENEIYSAALNEIETAPEPDHWVPEFQHCVDTAELALAEAIRVRATINTRKADT